MRFAKMHGLGNDFVMVNGFTEELPEDLGAFAKKVCERRLSIGADGLIVLSPSDKADAFFSLYNEDGSQAQMDGNGARCAAIFANMEGVVDKMALTFETPGGIVAPTIIDMENKIVTVDMGVPLLAPADIPADFSGARVIGAPLMVRERLFYVTLVAIGNPHCVIFVDDLEHFNVAKFGPLVETHPSFPAKTNAEFVQLLSDEKIRLRNWDRGVGMTLAGGTGACAAAVASILNGYTKRKVEVELAKGSLFLEWREDNHVMMTGPATFVAYGDYEI